MSPKRRTIAAQALVREVARDEADEPSYQWRRCGSQGQWLSGLEEGDGRALRAALPGPNVELALLLPGGEVVSQELGYSSNERRHLARLVPFELEESVTNDLDQLHFALGPARNGRVPVAYTEREWLARQIADLEALGFEINYCLPEPLLLPRPEGAWCLRLWGDELQVHYAEGLGFSAERAMAAAALKALCETQPLPQQLRLAVADEQDARQLGELLPQVLREELDDGQIHTQQLGGWDAYRLDQPLAMDLRQGEFARRLPLGRWWQEWRGVAVAAAAAVIAYAGVNLAQLQVHQAETADLREDITEVYREVVPQGNIANAERQLERQVAELEGGAADSGSVITMLGDVAPLIAEAEEVEVRRLTYDGRRGEMQVTLEAQSNSDILALSEAIGETGLRARPQNMSRSGDRQQASLRVTREGS